MDAFFTLCPGFYEYKNSDTACLIIYPFSPSDTIPLFMPISCTYGIDYIDGSCHTYYFSLFDMLLEFKNGSFSVDRQFLENAQKAGYLIPRGALIGKAKNIHRIKIYFNKPPNSIFINPKTLYTPKHMILVCDVSDYDEPRVSVKKSRSSASDLNIIQEELGEEL